MKWVLFMKRTEDPKLAWLERRLLADGIPSRRQGRSFHAPILEVPQDKLDNAWALLDTEVRVSGRMVRLDDVPDDHPMFKEEE